MQAARIVLWSTYRRAGLCQLRQGIIWLTNYLSLLSGLLICGWCGLGGIRLDRLPVLTLLDALHVLGRELPSFVVDAFFRLLVVDMRLTTINVLLTAFGAVLTIVGVDASLKYEAQVRPGCFGIGCLIAQ